MVLEESYEENFNIPYIFDSLPDGKYVIKEDGSYYDHKNLELIKRLHVKGVFFLKNGKVNGRALFYFPFKEAQEKLFELQFKNGKKNGQYRVTEYGRLIERGTYENDLLTDTLFQYDFRMGKEVLSEAFVYSKGGEEKTLAYYPHGELKEVYRKAGHNKSYLDPRVLLIEKLLGKKNVSHPNRKIRRNVKGFDLGTKYLLGKGEFKRYHPTGNLAVSGELVQDTAYKKWFYDTASFFAEYENGQKIVEFKSSEVGKIKAEVVIHYDEQGDVEGEYYYARGQFGPDLEPLKSVRYKNGKVKTIYNSRSYQLKGKKGAILPLLVYCENGVCDTAINYISGFGVTMPFMFEVGDTQSVQILSQSADEIKLKVEIEDFKSKVKLISFYTISTKRGLVTPPFNLHDWFFGSQMFTGSIKDDFSGDLYSFKANYSVEDSVVLLLDERPYSGEFKVINPKKHRKWNKLKYKRGELVLFSPSITSMPWFERSLGKVLLSANFSNGLIDGPFTNYRDTLFYEKGRLYKVKEYNEFRNGFHYITKDYQTDHNVLNGWIKQYNFYSLMTDEDYKKGPKYIHHLDEYYYVDSNKKNGEYKSWSVPIINPTHSELNFNYDADKRVYIVNFSPSDTAGRFGLSSIENYLNGQKEGAQKFYEFGKLVEKYKVLNSHFVGERIGFLNDDTLNYSNYESNCLEGLFYEKNEKNEFLKKGYYQTGLPVDKWTFYNKFGLPNIELDIKFSRHQKVCKDRFIFYGVGCEFGFIDTLGVSYPNFDINRVSDLSISGEVKYLYPNGNSYLTGRYFNGERIGDWLFYDEYGQVTKSYSFPEKIDSVNRPRFKLYNEKGKVHASGELHVWDTGEYNCEIDVEILGEILLFDFYVNEKGDTLVNNKTGYLKYVNEYGVLRQEGMLKDGLKEGEWRTYSKKGHLNKVGSFVNGLQEGDWFQGDLRGINFQDEACFIEETTDNSVRIGMTTYEKGVSINSNIIYAVRQ